MVRKVFFSILIALSMTAIIYGGFARKFRVWDNLEKFDQLKNVGITIKLPGYDQSKADIKVQSDWFTEPEMVRAMTFSGVGKYKDGRLMSKIADLRMLRGRLPCPT